MSTRAIVLAKINEQYGETNPNNGLKTIQFYHHSDGYTSGVGFELFNILFNKLNMYNSKPSILSNSSISVRSFLKFSLDNYYEEENVDIIHGDLEFIYEIDFNKDGIKLTVFKRDSSTNFDNCLHDQYSAGKLKGHVLLDIGIRREYYFVKSFHYDDTVNN